MRLTLAKSAAAPARLKYAAHAVHDDVMADVTESQPEVRAYLSGQGEAEHFLCDLRTLRVEKLRDIGRFCPVEVLHATPRLRAEGLAQ